MPIVEDRRPDAYKPRLSIIVLSWDCPELTRRCVDAVRENTVSSYELIVVDNGSRPHARELARTVADVAVLNDRNLGFAAGMNLGLDRSRGKYVAFLNNDAVVPSAWDEVLLRHLKNCSRVGMVVPAVTAAGNSLTVRPQPGIGSRLLEPFDEIPSAVLAVLRSQVIRELGGWNEAYFPASAEDADLAFSLWTNGLGIVLDERVLVEHVSKGTTRRKLPNWRVTWHENGRSFLQRWADPNSVVPILPDRAPERWREARSQAAVAARLRLQRVDALDTNRRRFWRKYISPIGERVRSLSAGSLSAAEGRRLIYVTLHARTPGQGAETHVAELVKYLERRGWSVTVLAPNPLRARAGVGERALEMFRVQLSILRERRPVALYVRHHPAGLGIAAWAAVRRVPRIEEVNGTLDDWYAIYPALHRGRWLMTQLSRALLSTAAGVAAVSNDLTNWACRHGARHVMTIANGVDTELFTPMAAPPAGLPDRYVVFVGALTPWSGIAACLEATIDPAWPAQLSLVVAGDGPLRTNLGNAKNVTYLGPIPHHAVPGLLAGSLAVLSPNNRTRTAGSPLKLYEAMASGRPVIATDVSGQAEIVRAAACGVVVPVDAPASIAQAAAVCLEDPAVAERWGRNGRDEARARHDWSQRAADVESLIEHAQ